MSSYLCCPFMSQSRISANALTGHLQLRFGHGKKAVLQWDFGTAIVGRSVRGAHFGFNCGKKITSRMLSWQEHHAINASATISLVAKPNRPQCDSMFGFRRHPSD